MKTSRFLLAATLLAPSWAMAADSNLDGPLTPEQAIASFKIEPGLRVELVASEPDVVSPVAIAFDEKGRMYVAEDRGYPVGPGKGKPPVGQIVLLESIKGDGHYDKRTVFADKLTFPNGVMPWKGGVYVTCAPYLYYFKDTNGDGVADIKKIVFKGFQDLSTTQLRVSHPILNIDNWVYLTSGLTVARVTSPLYPNHPQVLCDRTDFRFRPDTDDFEATTGTAQFGQTFDDFGRKFVCSNRNHNQHVVLETRYVKRNPNLSIPDVVQDIPDHGAAARVYAISHNITTFADQAGYFTSACGITFYDGTALPEQYRGNTFTCEPAGNLAHRDILSPSNETFVAKRAYDGLEFFASPDNWCRPVNLANGPDGAFYLCDMYRKTIEHPDYLPEATRKVTDFESGKDKGRIYRIVAADHKDKPIKFDLTHASFKKLVGLLNDPNIWWRMTAQRLLLERNDPKAAPLLKALCQNGKTPQARVHALRTLEGIGCLDEATILHALGDADPNVREHGIHVAEPRLASSPALLDRLLAMAGDENARVRFQCALSLGESSDERVIPALAKIAEHGLDDKWTRTAVLTAVGNRPDELLHHLLTEGDKSSDGMSAMLVESCRVVGVTVAPEKLSPLLDEIAASSAEKDFAWQLAAITGLADGLSARSGATLSLLELSKNDATRARLAEMIKRSATTALDSAHSMEQRMVAIQLLSCADAAAARPTLEKLIDPQQPTELQIAAVRAMGRVGDPVALQALLDRNRWSGLMAPVRDVVLGLVISKPALTTALLNAVEKNDIPAWSVSMDRRNQIMRSKDEATRQRAATLFKDRNAGDRMKIWEEYKATALPLPPHPDNGRKVFLHTCTPCHIYEGQGHVVGPDLTGIRTQPKEVTMLHIIIPEYEIVPVYTLYLVETKDGDNYSGLLVADTPESITLRQAAAVEQRIPRSKIASMRASSLSLMPDDLEKGMSKQDMADLLSFLKGEGDAPGK